MWESDTAVFKVQSTWSSTLKCSLAGITVDSWSSLCSRISPSVVIPCFCFGISREEALHYLLSQWTVWLTDLFSNPTDYPSVSVCSRLMRSIRIILWAPTSTLFWSESSCCLLQRYQTVTLFQSYWKFLVRKLFCKSAVMLSLGILMTSMVVAVVQSSWSDRPVSLGLLTFQCVIEKTGMCWGLF